MSTPVDDIATELFAITLTNNNAHSDSHHKLWVSHSEVQQDKGKAYLDAELTVNNTQHITHTLQAAEMRLHSKAEVTLNVVESRMERAHIQLSCATSRDVLWSIRNDLAATIKTLTKVKHKVSSIVSRKTRLETSCDKMQKLLFRKEDGLPLLSGPVEFDSSRHYNLSINYSNEIAQVSLFLGAVSIVIFGIGRRHGEFLMGVLSLILSLAMDAQNPHSESRQQNTLSQIL
ncbi:uncharacterized protein EDB91DRAFT_1253348 [Suillus paluster]|uniref:uncharacterized protein n=1 Tax=Suillus paluster TaxID=48578 RepID=UPI001B88431B|nr:uncharacterized protein EDB91DRAFT_1253348 [Suillus paluster]KAG1728749.1 hypothetical protein EDB91DRAFT_1253348 [Suillus paluster]